MAVITGSQGALQAAARQENQVTVEIGKTVTAMSELFAQQQSNFQLLAEENRLLKERVSALESDAKKRDALQQKEQEAAKERVELLSTQIAALEKEIKAIATRIDAKIGQLTKTVSAIKTKNNDRWLIGKSVALRVSTGGCWLDGNGTLRSYDDLD